MAHGVVAVHESHAGSIAQDSDDGPGIDSAALNLFHVLWQTEHAVGVTPARIGFGHEGGHLTRALWRNSRGRQCSGNKFNQDCDRNERHAGRSFCSFAHILCKALWIAASQAAENLKFLSFRGTLRAEESLVLLNLKPREIPHFVRIDKIAYFFRGLFSQIILDSEKSGH
jgi:hypothetical protein